MTKMRQAMCAMMMAGGLLLFAQGCSKTVEGTSGSKTTEQGLARPAEPSRPAESSPPVEPSPLTLPGEERVKDEIAVAKAEPSSEAVPAASQRVRDMEQEAAQAAAQRVRDMEQEAAATAGAGLQDAFFGFDSWAITDDGRKALGADAQWLKANGARGLTVEGHCDERGTQAYNLVLGEKRAKAVKNYLADLGVEAKRVSAVSYGKDRPFCREQTEDCYQQNRRGHLVLKVK